jgi:hypothetical protein
MLTRSTDEYARVGDGKEVAGTYTDHRSIAAGTVAGANTAGEGAILEGEQADLETPSAHAATEEAFDAEPAAAYCTDAEMLCACAEARARANSGNDHRSGTEMRAIERGSN